MRVPRFGPRPLNGQTIRRALPDNEIRPLNDKELSFLASHPPGFDRDFFQLHLPVFVLEFQTQRNLSPGAMLVVVELRNETKIRLSGIRVALTWIMLISEADEILLVPLNEIVGVTILRRAVPVDRPVGFTATQIESP
jgi:hypothetical protein